jgi:hypothetical protein
VNLDYVRTFKHDERGRLRWARANVAAIGALHRRSQAFYSR